jgi:phosphoribosylpyrophosphate synthetase
LETYEQCQIIVAFLVYPWTLISKLPLHLVPLTGKVISEEYSLEYGTDTIEMHVGAVEPGERAIIIDDLIATGGTLAAAIRLLGKSKI